MALKGNRLVALGEADRKNGHYIGLDPLQWPEQKAVTGWLKGLDFPVRLVRQVFTNKDGSSGILYLVCSKLEAGWDAITTTYPKRWKVEVFHKIAQVQRCLRQVTRPHRQNPGQPPGCLHCCRVQDGVFDYQQKT